MSARSADNCKNWVYLWVCISVWFKYVTSNCICQLCSKLISCHGPEGKWVCPVKCAFWYFSLLFLLWREKIHPAFYISLESMLCSFKPVTNFSSELAQLPKQEKEQKEKKKRKKEDKWQHSYTTAKPEGIRGTARLPTVQTQKRLFPKLGVIKLRAIGLQSLP